MERTLQTDLSEVLQRALEKGKKDGTITVEKMIEDLKAELLNIKEES